MKQLSLFPELETAKSISKAKNTSERNFLSKKFSSVLSEDLHLGKLVSYVGNKDLPILRLYRYKEAFAFSLVKELIHRFNLTEEDYLLEPFCGMGTTPFTAMQHSIPSVGVDRLPIASFLAQTLPLFQALESKVIHSTFEEIKEKVTTAEPAEVALDVKIMQTAFPENTLLSLRRWKTVIQDLPFPIRDIFLLLFLSILEPCSYTAKDGQFLRLKRDRIIPNPTTILQQKVYEAEQDLVALKQLWGNQKKAKIPNIQLGDARDLSTIQFDKPPTAIITSPPYPNRYDYTRTYSLELCFNFVKNFEELKALRFGILRSHIESKVNSTDHPPHPAVQEVIDILKEQEKTLNNRRIPDMLTAYFVDMQQVIREWSRVLAPGGKVAIVVDNVRFAGEMIPVDLILSDMAEAVGFKVQKIIVARYKGNSSQQMGKYGRIPVRESILIWQKEN